MRGCPPSRARRMRSIALLGAAAGAVTAVLIASIVTRLTTCAGYNAAMANPEHAKLLLSPEWNAWRVKNPNVTADLTGADLTGQDLSGRDLKRADLTRADLSRATLAGTDLTRATLRNA